MGSIKHPKESSGGRLGKIDAPLGKKLQAVKWGEYMLEKLFDSSNGDFDIQKKHINNKGDYVITAGLTNNGILGKTDVPAKVFEPQTITVDMFGSAFYRQFKYKMVTHARVFSLKPKFKINDERGLFLSNSLKFLEKFFGYENMCSWEKIKNRMIALPQTSDGEIDFNFMESFVRELEEERVRELAAYLKASDLADTTLTASEKAALNAFDTLEWGEFRIGELFDRILTAKLPYKAADLPKDPTTENPLPCLTSSFMNQGLNYYAPRKNATILKNVISIPSNSDVYRAYYQSQDFTVLSDAYAIRWVFSDKEISAQQYLFMVACINQVTDLPIYSYKNKLGGWNVVQDKNIMLPVRDGEPDYMAMQDFISAVQKLVIKDVVAYADRKIAASKAVIYK